MAMQTMFCLSDGKYVKLNSSLATALEAPEEVAQQRIDYDEGCEAQRMGYNVVYELLNEGKLKANKNRRIWRIPGGMEDHIYIERAGEP